MSFTKLNPATLLVPAPAVMVSCALPGGNPNIITIAWAGTLNSNPPMLSISVRPHRFSYDIIQKSGEFVVNMVSRDLVWATDFCGVKSGSDTDKFAVCKLTPHKLDSLHSAPAILESPLYLACKVRQTIPLLSHTVFIAEVVETGVQDHLLDESGKINLQKASLAAYCHGQYYGLDAPLGFFGYSIAKPEVLKRRMPQANKR